MRTILVGDIHGCYRQFIDLLKKVDYHKKKDRLILMGDLMDRGPDSYEMYSLARKWKEEMPDQFFMVRGNHDHYIVEHTKDLEMRLIWRCVGKMDTVRSFKKHHDSIWNAASWIEENMEIWHTEPDFRCVHAAIEHDVIEDNEVDLLVKDHSYSKKNLYGGPFTIIGHTPLEAPTYYDGSGKPGIPLSYHEWRTLPKTGVLCIDTGCVYGRKLTAMIVEDGRYCLDFVPGQCYTQKNTQKYIPYIQKAFRFRERILGIEREEQHI